MREHAICLRGASCGKNAEPVARRLFRPRRFAYAWTAQVTGRSSSGASSAKSRKNRRMEDQREVVFACEGATVTLRIALGPNPPGDVGAEWRPIEGEVELRLAPAGGSVAVTREIVLIRSDVDRFVTQLDSILAALDGNAVLEHPSDLELTVALHRGRGTLSGFVATQYPAVKVVFEGFATDQSYLSAPLAALNEILRGP